MTSPSTRVAQVKLVMSGTWRETATAATAALNSSGPQQRWLATHPSARPALSLYRTPG